MQNIVTEIKITAPNEDCKLTVTFGDGQKGHSSLKTINGKYITGKVENLNIGHGEQLKGKKMLISSIVTDVNPHTNWMSVTYFINGSAIKSLQHHIESDNGSLYCTTTLSFE